jgi:hypothetical protein
LILPKKKSSKIWAKNAQSKQTPKMRKFVESGHPAYAPEAAAVHLDGVASRGHRLQDVGEISGLKNQVKCLVWKWAESFWVTIPIKFDGTCVADAKMGSILCAQLFFKACRQ